MQQYTERCAMCNKSFKTKDGLESHLQGHTKTYFVCPLCKDIDPKAPDREFRAEKAFRFHLKWHKLGEPYYVCEICGVKKRVAKIFREPHINP